MRCGVCGITPRTCFRTRTRTRCTPKWPPSRGRLARYADTVDPRTEGEVSGFPSNHFGLVVVAFEAANKFIESLPAAVGGGEVLAALVLAIIALLVAGDVSDRVEALTEKVEELEGSRTRFVPGLTDTVRAIIVLGLMTVNHRAKPRIVLGRHTMRSEAHLRAPDDAGFCDATAPAIS